MLKILTYPNEALRRPAKEVARAEFRTGKIVDLILEMVEAMTEAKGIGLAAPQVGVSKQVIVVAVGNFSAAFCNPKILSTSGSDSYDEGCLSFPDQNVMVERPAAITLQYLDMSGAMHVSGFQGMVAKVIQHEIDHLNGKLMIDYKKENL